MVFRNNQKFLLFSFFEKSLFCLISYQHNQKFRDVSCLWVFFNITRSPYYYLLDKEWSFFIIYQNNQKLRYSFSWNVFFKITRRSYYLFVLRKINFFYMNYENNQKFLLFSFLRNHYFSWLVINITRSFEMFLASGFFST